MKSVTIYMVSKLLQGILLASVMILFFNLFKSHQQPPETIEIHRYYNEESQVECFYHQNAISCLWVMGEVK